MAVKYSPAMQAKIDELGLKPENILYLNIMKVHYNRILSGEKKVEFRDNNDFYLGKLDRYDKNGKPIGRKFISHLLLQAGMEKDSPRALIALQNIYCKFEKDEQGPAEIFVRTHLTDNEGTKVKPDPIPEAKLKYPDLFEAAQKEGFTDDDPYIAFGLEKVVFSEN